MQLHPSSCCSSCSGVGVRVWRMSQVLSQSPANRDDCKGEAAELGLRPPTFQLVNNMLSTSQCTHREERARGLQRCFSVSSRLPHPVWPNAGAFWFWFNQLPVETRELCLLSARSFSELTQPQWEHCIKASDLPRTQKHTKQSRAA